MAAAERKNKTHFLLVEVGPTLASATKTKATSLRVAIAEYVRGLLMKDLNIASLPESEKRREYKRRKGVAKGMK